MVFAENLSLNYVSLKVGIPVLFFVHLWKMSCKCCKQCTGCPPKNWNIEIRPFVLNMRCDTFGNWTEWRNNYNFPTGITTELYYITGDRAPDEKAWPKTWRILRHNRPTFMGASTDQWLKCPCATEFNPPWFYSLIFFKKIVFRKIYMVVLSVRLPKSQFPGLIMYQVFKLRVMRV